MLYAKGGWAGARLSARAINLTNNELAEFTDWSNGWTVGVGLEHVPWQSIVIGVEADFYGSLSLDRSGLIILGFQRGFLTAVRLFGP